MSKVYLLIHSYDYGENCEHTEIKILGIFSNLDMAINAVETYKNLSGFIEFSVECFHIEEYELNSMEWKEGFIR